MASYIQNTPDVPPEYSLKDQMDSWKVIGRRSKDRPTKQMNKFNLKNMFSVTLRDTGEVALIDGDTKEIRQYRQDRLRRPYLALCRLPGRYVYVIGRDGRVSLIDLWMEKAQPSWLKSRSLSMRARLIPPSSGALRIKYAIAGGYWPPQYTIMEGDTLKPLKVVSTRGVTVDGDYHPEPRVASIVSSFIKPEWVVNIKETGQILMVDYSDIEKPEDHHHRVPPSSCTTAAGMLPSATSWWQPTPPTRSLLSTPRPASWPRWLMSPRFPHPGRWRQLLHPTFGPRLGNRSPGCRCRDPDQHGFGRSQERSTRSTTGRSCQKSSTSAATCSSRPIRSPSTCGLTRHRTRTRTSLSR